MTPEQFIAILKQANAAQLVEIRALLGLTTAYPCGPPYYRGPSYTLPVHTTPDYNPPDITPPSFPGPQPAFPYRDYGTKVWCGTDQQ